MTFFIIARRGYSLAECLLLAEPYIPTWSYWPEKIGVREERGRGVWCSISPKASYKRRPRCLSFMSPHLYTYNMWEKSKRWLFAWGETKYSRNYRDTVTRARQYDTDDQDDQPPDDRYHRHRPGRAGPLRVPGEATKVAVSQDSFGNCFSWIEANRPLYKPVRVQCPGYSKFVTDPGVQENERDPADPDRQPWSVSWVFWVLIFSSLQ